MGTEGETTERQKANTENENDEETEQHSGNATRRVSGNGTLTSLEQYSETVVGKMGGKSYSELIKEFRATFLKIDNMLVDELNDLFFGLWN